MAINYYYFVSGLPDLLLDEGKHPVGFSAFIEEAAEQLTPEDMEIIDTIRLPIDNKNLISLLDSPEGKFDSRAKFSKDELLTALRSSEQLPRYMQLFLEAHREGRQLFAGLVEKDQLNWLFYEEMLAHKSDFVKEWFNFDLNLRNVLAALNSRKGLEHLEALATERDRPIAFNIVGRNDVAEAILRSSANDFGLASTLPWIEKLTSAGRGDLVEFEKTVDQLRWETIDEMTTFSYFGIETVAAFALKLLIVERWLKLDPSSGRSKLDRLVENLRESFSVPAGF